MKYKYTAVTATLNRAKFIPQVVRSFLRQTLPQDQIEWLILDDGDDETESLIPKQPNIRYMRVPPMTLGAKHNLSSHEAQGDVVAHWDSDDWHAPHRAEQQLIDVQRTGLCGMGSIDMWDVATHQCWRYVSQLDWFITGGSLCYRREYGMANPFGDTNYEDDLNLCKAHRGDVFAGPDNSLVVSSIHLGNTSPRNLGHLCYVPLRPEDMPGWFQQEGLELLPGVRSR